MRELQADFAVKSHRPSDDQMDGLRDVVSTLVAMAEGSCAPATYLSSLDPGVGKTTAVSNFIQQLVQHPDYEGVSVLMCLPRVDEISRVVNDMNLSPEDFAILTRDEATNQLSSTRPAEARILLTTHEMVKKRCRGRSFEEVDALWYRGQPRCVRVWDEAMLPGDVISVSTDDLGKLINSVGQHDYCLTETLRGLQIALSGCSRGSTFDWPNFTRSYGAVIDKFIGQLADDDQDLLRNALWLSGRTIKVASENGRKRTALDTRDMLPQDFQPVLVLDASGRVRSTYDYWEKVKGGLMRLKSATKRYENLRIHVLNRGAGQHAWQDDNADELLKEVAATIATKPSETWLVVHHGKACRGQFEQRLRTLLPKGCSNISFLTWGRHQGTNDYGEIANVILAGTTFYPDSQYEGLSYLSSGQPMTGTLSKEIINDIRQGEHSHHILQALCRASVRGSDGPKCKPCNAYIIAAKGSGIRDSLPDIFPGCRVKDWKPKHKALRGQVRKAVDYVEGAYRDSRNKIVMFSDVMEHLAISNKSNFNRTILKHADFKDALVRLGLQNVSTDGGRYHNAIASASSFGPLLGASYSVG